MHNHLQFCRRITGRTCTGREDKHRGGARQVESFAQRLMLRYGIFLRDTAGPGKTFRAAFRNINLRPVQHFIQVNLAPRLALTVLQWTIGKSSLPESRPLRTKEQLPLQQIFEIGGKRSLAQSIEGQRPLQQASGVGNELDLIENMTHHIVMRSAQSLFSKYQFRSTGTDRAQFVPEKSQLATPPVQKIFRTRSVPALPDAGGSQGMSHPPTTLTPYVSGSAQAFPHGTVYGNPANGLSGLNARDINHLTNEVIQAIDQRILAQRERLGRV